MPLSTRRSFARCTPRGLLGRNGLIVTQNLSQNSRLLSIRYK